MIISPSYIAIIDFVIPHPGQGKPVINFIEHSDCFVCKSPSGFNNIRINGNANTINAPAIPIILFVNKDFEIFYKSIILIIIFLI